MDDGATMPAPADANPADANPADPNRAGRTGETAADPKADTPAAKGLYPAASALPTREGPDGIRFDFNVGARVLLPQRTAGSWRVCLRDLDTGNILFQSENKGALVRSAKRYFVRIGIEVWSVDDAGIATEVFTHRYDCRNQDVLIQLPVGTLGDTIGWFPYVARFAAERGARVTCAMAGQIAPLLRDSYPHIRFVTHEETTEQDLPSAAYATYSVGLFFADKDNVFQPTDFRQVGLHRTAGYILGVDPAEEPPLVPGEIPRAARPAPQVFVEGSAVNGQPGHGAGLSSAGARGCNSSIRAAAPHGAGHRRTTTGAPAAGSARRTAGRAHGRARTGSTTRERARG
jgi:hypothetical protein